MATHYILKPPVVDGDETLQWTTGVFTKEEAAELINQGILDPKVIDDRLPAKTTRPSPGGKPALETPPPGDSQTTKPVTPATPTTPTTPKK